MKHWRARLLAPFMITVTMYVHAAGVEDIIITRCIGAYCLSQLEW